MASSNVVIASASPTTNSELPRQSSICSLSTFIADLHHNQTHDDDDEEEEASRNLASVAAMDDILKSIYSESPQPQQLQDHPSESPFPADGVDEVWKRIVAGGTDRRAEVVGGGGDGGAMTLEDFLSKNGAVREEDVMVAVGGYGQFQAAPMVVYGNGSGAATPAARVRRRVVEEPLDKATQQKQRRMIKNRESAARSRERKQAYTVELESLVTQLEEENTRLLREQAEWYEERRKQLMENLVPFLEKKENKKIKEKEIVENFHLQVEKRRTFTLIPVVEKNEEMEKEIAEKLLLQVEKTRTRTPPLRRCYSAKW
ncbi:bZIP transcription factor 12 [Morus notabilis]|uniref:bZIP transcription factor 12 n=1 Tax=Morus notabilis TaxID=981085 RepID=UPI000CECEE9D|nr:bZIP transcription factor 12 [Morus notabilis]